MSDAKINIMPPLQAKTIQVRPLRAELRPGRRWKWWGKRGWWLHCALLNEQERSWHRRSFVATVSEACTLLNIHEDDWTWRQPVEVEAEPDRQSDHQVYWPFLLL